MNVSSTGLVQATPSVASSGYFEAGPLSPATLQLTTQAAQTITPGTADKTIASGRYLTGTQTIKGDANLVAGNIKSGISIFGVAGTVEEGEDVTAETETYTDLLTDLEAAVDALPDAGSGSGGSVETCSIEVKLINTSSTSYVLYYVAEIYENGTKQFVVKNAIGGDTFSLPLTVENVVCGSLFILSITSTQYMTNSGLNSINVDGYTRMFEVTAAAGETATFTGS